MDQQQITVRPKCDILIDQRRHIDADPVGHRCYNDATRTDGEYLVCDDCLRMLTQEPERATLPARGSAKTWQHDAQNIVDRLVHNAAGNQA